jgi:hypothetical protein
MSLTKIPGSGSGSVGQRYGSADPGPHQNVTDPQYLLIVLLVDEVSAYDSASWAGSRSMQITTYPDPEARNF